MSVVCSHCCGILPQHEPDCRALQIVGVGRLPAHIERDIAPPRPMLDLQATGRASQHHPRHRELRAAVLDLVEQLAVRSLEIQREHQFSATAEQVLAFIAEGDDPELRLDCMRRAFRTFTGNIRLATAEGRARDFEAFMLGKPAVGL